MLLLLALATITLIVAFRRPRLAHRYATCEYCQHKRYRHGGRDDTCTAMYRGMPICNCPGWKEKIS